MSKTHFSVTRTDDTLPLGIFSNWSVFHEDSHLKNVSFVIGIFK